MNYNEIFAIRLIYWLDCYLNGTSTQKGQLVQMLRCINLYDVRLLLRPYAMQFGELREVGNLLVLIIPGWDRGSCLLINIGLISMSRTEIVNTVLNIIILV